MYKCIFYSERFDKASLRFSLRKMTCMFLSELVCSLLCAQKVGMKGVQTKILQCLQDVS